MADFTLLIDLGMIVVAATLFGYIARLLKQPSMLAYILAGIAIGPIGLGAMSYFFGGTHIAIGATLQVAAVIGAVLLFSYLFPILSFEQAIYLGVILAFSSTMVVIKLLGDNYQINTLHGRLLIGFLLIQDFLVILAIPLLKDIGSAFAPNFWALVLVKTLILIAAAGIINRHILPKLFKFSLNYQEEFFLAALSSCMIFIGLAYFLDMPIAVGAFIGGLALSTLPYYTEIFNKIRGIRDLFVIVFFVSLGMQLQFSFATVPIGLIVFMIAIVLLLKPIMYYGITLFSGYGSKVSVLVALGLANVSEFSLIIAQQGFDPLNPETSILSTELFSVIILTITISMVIAPYLMKSYGGIHKVFEEMSKHIPKKLKRKRFSARLSNLEAVPKKLSDHILIIGGGTMGFNIARTMYKHFPTLVVDQDSEVVYSCIRQGIKATYGDVEETEVLKKINTKKAKLIVLAIPNIKATLRALSFIKKENKKTPVFARAHYYRDALALYQGGADYVFMPYVIGGNVFLKDIGRFLDTGKLSTVINLQDEYLKYLKEKAKEEKQHFGF